MKPIEIKVISYDQLKNALVKEMQENEILRHELRELREELEGRCADERPQRKVLCQLPKYHSGSHQAVIYWEGK